MTPAIELLRADVPSSTIDALATLLVDAVDSGATVSFLGGLTHAEATEWWKAVISDRASRSIVLIACEGTDIVGSVQMHPAWAPNQTHRGEVAKLLVHRRARRHGVGTALMRAVEQQARDSGFTVL